jgi:hypothetical protein
LPGIRPLCVAAMISNPGCSPTAVSSHSACTRFAAGYQNTALRHRPDPQKTNSVPPDSPTDSSRLIRCAKKPSYHALTYRFCLIFFPARSFSLTENQKMASVRAVITHQYNAICKTVAIWVQQSRAKSAKVTNQTQMRWVLGLVSDSPRRGVPC